MIIIGLVVLPKL